MAKSLNHISPSVSKEVQALVPFLRVGLGLASPEDVTIPTDVDWFAVVQYARWHKVVGVFADGIVKMPLGTIPDRRIMLKAIGYANRYVNMYDQKFETVSELAEFWSKAGIRTLILKGMSFARYYPEPKHRYSSDVDVYVSDFGKSNKMLKLAGVSVDESEQKHSRVLFKGVTIENHQHCCGQVGDEKVMSLDACLLGMLAESSEGFIQDSKLEYPQLLFDALFFTYHARTHLLIEDGIKLSHIVDWIMIRQKLAKSDLSKTFHELCDKYGLTKFLNAIDGVCDYVECQHNISKLSKSQALLFADIFAPVNFENSTTKSKSKSKTESRINILKCIWHNRNKYPLYSDMTVYSMLINYIKGYLSRFL